MKKLIAVIVLSVIASVTARAVSFPAIGPATFKLTAITQAQNFTVTSSKTNVTATSTNTTLVVKATVGKTPFNSDDFLHLVENSFNTTFPAGSQIAFRFGQIYVVDSSGTNIIFDLNSVVTVHIEEEVESGIETEVTTQNSGGSTFSGNATEVFTTSATMAYDDSARPTTTDGTHTVFQFKGLMVVTFSQNLKTGASKANITFQGTGGGPVRGVNTILTGTITVKATGAPFGI